MKLSTQKRCIFCRQSGLSREHIFGDWLRAIFPRSSADTHLHGMTTWGQAKSGKIYAMPTLKIEQGHSGSKKVKHVCKACNNGWMSRMEMRARPILMPLIQGTFHKLSVFDQKSLAGWVAKTIMVAEFTYPDRVAVSEDDRLRMYASQEPSDNWKIWIAHYNGIKHSRLSISYHGCALGPSEPPAPDNTTPANTQFTNIGMGHLFIHASSTTTRADFQFDDETFFRRIWPPTDRDLIWPPLTSLGEEDADYVIGALSRLTGMPG